DHRAAGHVFAAVVAGAFHDSDGAGVAHGEALARDAAEITLAGDGAVEHRVADDDALLGLDARDGVRAHDQLAARKALADVVVTLAHEVERNAAGSPSAEALASGAVERDPDRVLGQAGMAITLRHLTRQHRAGRAVDIADRELGLDRLLALERRLAQPDQLFVEHLVEAVVLRLAVEDGDRLGHAR